MEGSRYIQKVPMSRNVAVFCRVRPPDDADQPLSVDVQDNQLFINQRALSLRQEDVVKRHCFSQLSGIFDYTSSQEQCFSELGSPLIDALVDGRNGAAVFYGATGTGKTFSAEGFLSDFDEMKARGEVHPDEPEPEIDAHDIYPLPHQAGFVYRALTDIFQRIQSHNNTSPSSRVGEVPRHRLQLHVSFYELYLNRIFDLLAPPREDGTLQQCEVLSLPPSSGSATGSWQPQSTVIRPLHSVQCNTLVDAVRAFRMGRQLRRTASTSANLCSSRSHSVFEFQLHFLPVFDNQLASNDWVEPLHVSRLRLIDLAGSEQALDSGLDAVLLREGRDINQSLLSLTQVVIQLRKLSAPSNVDDNGPMSARTASSPRRSASPHARASRSQPSSPRFRPSPSLSNSQSSGIGTEALFRSSTLTRILSDALSGNSITHFLITVSPLSVDVSKTLNSLQFAIKASSVTTTPAASFSAGPAVDAVWSKLGMASDPLSIATFCSELEQREDLSSSRVDLFDILPTVSELRHHWQPLDERKLPSLNRSQFSIYFLWLKVAHSIVQGCYRITSSRSQSEIESHVLVCCCS